MTHHTGPWAHQPRRQRPGFCIRCLVFIGAITVTAGFIAAFAFGDVPPHYEAPRGYDICKTARC